MRPLPSLRQLGYLTALAETLNFTRAAERCLVTQSTLSAGLKELELTLGVQLVERDRHSVLLRPIGADVVARARELLAAAADLVDLAATAALPMTGTLRLGIIPTIAPFLLPALVQHMRAAHPALKLGLREDLTARLLDRLTTGELDAALIALPYDTGTLAVRALYPDELVLLAPPDHPVLDMKPVALTEPVAGQLLLLEEGHCLREHVLEACAQHHVVAAGGMEATSLLTVAQMVAAGLGLALVPDLALRGGLIGNLIIATRRLPRPAPARTLALVARPSTARQREIDAVAHTLIDLNRAR